ncbi:MAG: amidohydrolase family protein, partial [Candidatus Hodarchaeota archaeon]
WWREVEPHSYGPPYFLSLERYGKILEEKLGFAIDWRTFGEYLAKVETMGISVNYVPLVGHNAVRLAVMGMDFKRRAKPAEIEAMKKHVEEAMTSGAHGFTTNLDGVPGVGEYANTEEIIELAKVAQKFDGIYAAHTRNCDNNYPGEIEEYGYGICHNITPAEMHLAKYYGLLEAIEVGRRARVRTQISHLILVYLIYQDFPKYLQEAVAKATLEIIDKAKAEGIDIAFDIEPDPDIHAALMAASNLIEIFFKRLTQIGSRERFVKNLKIKAFRDELKKEMMNGKFKILMIHPKTDPYWFNRIKILVCRNKDHEGKTIGEISHEKNMDPMDIIFDVIIEDPDTKFNCTDDRRWTEIAQRVFIQHPLCTVGMDIQALPSLKVPPYKAIWPGAGAPGLGFYGFYPRYIRKFVKEWKYLTLEEAVKKATYLPAQRFGLEDRGLISPGAYADILVFDFAKIAEKGTPLDPRQAPEGIHYTIVNGKVAYEKLAHTKARPGKVLRHKYPS